MDKQIKNSDLKNFNLRIEIDKKISDVKKAQINKELELIKNAPMSFSVMDTLNEKITDIMEDEKFNIHIWYEKEAKWINYKLFNNPNKWELKNYKNEVDKVIN